MIEMMTEKAITAFASPEFHGFNRNLCEIMEVANHWMRGTHQDWLTMELYLDEVPESFQFTVVNGIEAILRYAETLNFNAPELLEYLKALPCFSCVPSAFFDDYLAHLSFTGNIYSLPEGTVVFPGSLLLSIHAPRGQLELLEKHISGILNIQSLHTTLAAKIRLVAGGHRYLIEYGFPTPSTPEAALECSRSSYIGGFNGTSNVLAAYNHPDIPLLPLISKPIQQPFQARPEALTERNTQQYTQELQLFPDGMLCVRTLPEATAAITSLNTLSEKEGFDRLRFKGFCIDGVSEQELSAVTMTLRRFLIDEGCGQAGIVLAGPFEEGVIDQLEGIFRDQGLFETSPNQNVGPVHGELYYGVCPFHLCQGQTLRLKSRMVYCDSQGDSPAWHCELKQVYRFFDTDGHWSGDHQQSFEYEPPMAGMPMMHPIVSHGKRLEEPQPLDLIRTRTWANIHSLPPELLYSQ